MARFRRLLALIGLITVSVLPSAFGDDRTDGIADPAQPDTGATQPAGLPFQTKLVGVEDRQLAGLLQATLAPLVAGKRVPETLNGIERRTQSHIKALQALLRSEGYYGGKLTYDIDAGVAPVAVVVNIDPGPRYVIKQYSIEYDGPGSEDPRLPSIIGDVGMELGGAARSDFVLDIEDNLLRHLADSGHPLARANDRQVLVDHADRSMAVTLQVAPGAVAHFGPSTIQPMPTVDEEYVRGFVTWEQGQVFERSRIDSFRSALLDTGLFDSVAVERPGALNADGELPLSVQLSERKHRSIGLEGHWSTDVGLGLEVFWEHRNLLGKQEQLTLTARLEEIRQELDLRFRKPRYLRQDQALLADGIWGNQDTDAFQGPLATGFVGLERQVGQTWTLSAGVLAEASNLEDFQGTRDYQLFGAALRAVRDTSDDRLDPTRGTRLRLELTPYHAGGDGEIDVLESRISGSAYYPLRDDSRAILAARARLGGITGAESANLPANRRFYAGGGTSIRGYALQSVGPLAPDGTPLGGRSLVELSAELRLKLSEILGGVVFIDGGNVFDDTVPEFSNSLRWAAGFGALYFTAVGPIRLDFGFPLDRRSIDDSFQFYISVGQAF